MYVFPISTENAFYHPYIAHVALWWSSGGLLLHRSKSTFLIIFLTVLVALEGFSLAGLQSEYNELNRRWSVHETLYTQLNASYNYLNESYRLWHRNMLVCGSTMKI